MGRAAHGCRDPPDPPYHAYAVLLLVALRGPSSPYDLKRALGQLAAEFWAVPPTQVYSEAARLARRDCSA